MKLRALVASLAILVFTAGIVYAADRFSVRSGEFDPGNTFLVQAQWLDGIGCPAGTSYNDPACAAANDSSDKRNQGLLLAKTGPTATNASAFAVIRGISGPVTELGYDLRKPTSAASPMGSHCGAGAPRFNVETRTAFYFIGCNSPPAVQTAAGLGWIRLRWGGSAPLVGFNTTTGTFTTVTGDVKSISILFDEGQDTGPDFFGLAVIDNIDVNGTLVGRGDNADDKGKKDRHKDKDHGDDDDDEGDDD
jgi:hypothetical protein